jgi:hypothetical protein
LIVENGGLARPVGFDPMSVPGRAITLKGEQRQLVQQHYWQEQPKNVRFFIHLVTE